MSSKKLLLVEDDLEISELLCSLLIKEGFEPLPIFNGNDAEQIALRENFDLIILDIMLPGKNGLDVLRSIRAKKSTPILMLTAKGDDLDRIIGFEMGADDYLPKPFNPRELIARIKALLRRVDMDMQVLSEHPDTLENEQLKVNLKSREVFLSEEFIELTATEFNVLTTLLLHPNEVVSKNELTQQALGRKLSLYDRAIDMHVSNLRKKISDTAIKTIRGQGYMYQISSTKHRV
jgi:two-component system response regulator CpxR